jgi:hypothetical protein
LLSRLRPVREESLQSYILRLCEKNGWKISAFKSYLKLVAASMDSKKDTDRKKIINYLIGSTKQQEIFNLVDIRSFANTHKDHFDLSKIKYCPKCFSEKIILLPVWSIRHNLVCTIHNELLIECCSKCNCKFDEETFSMKRCSNCLSHLTLMTSTQISPDKYSVAINRTFFGFVGDSEQFIKLFENNLSGYRVKIRGLHALVTFERDFPMRRERRAFMSIDSKFKQYVKCQKLCEDHAFLVANLIDYIYFKKKVRVYDLGKILASFKFILKEKDNQFFKDAIDELIFLKPELFFDCRVGLGWLEQYFQFSENELSSFAKTQCDYMILPNRGGPSIRIINIPNLLKKYNEGHR